MSQTRASNTAGTADETRMLQELVAKFVDHELLPLEPAVLKREAQGEGFKLSDAEEKALLARCRELGLWGLDVPESFGGANLPLLALAAVEEELARACVPFIIPPDSPNLHMMLAVATPMQRERYLAPYASGEMRSAMAISEPGAGGDPAGMITRAVRDGDHWLINGRKIWVSNVPRADFIILMARTGAGKRQEGISAFIVEKGTPGYIIEREIPMIGGRKTYELVFDECRVPAANLLGELDRGYAPMQLRLNVRRMQMGARCIGMARRALDMMAAHARERITWGVRLADRQAIQWFAAEAAMEIHACRLMVNDLATKLDTGADVRMEASILKVRSTEMAQSVLDNAMQTFGAMGMTKELPLQLMHQQVRLMRIYEGPSEVHRSAIGRRVLGSKV
jgi:alkylation response protein AidB-like acyl-CoA dehydrogenase